MKNLLNPTKSVFTVLCLLTLTAAQGQSEMSTGITSGAGAGNSIMRSADVNGDGKKDVLLSALNTQNVQFFLNLLPNTSANLKETGASFKSVGPIADFICVDLNRDKLPELVTADFTQNSLQISKNISANATFAFGPQQSVSTTVQPMLLLSCDLNFDGYSDLIVAGKHKVEVLQNTCAEKGGVVAFQKIGMLDVKQSINGLKCADIDGDGLVDIIVSTESGFSTFIGKADAFIESFTTDEFTIVSGIDIGDLDGDYLPEILLSHWPENTITIVRNISQPGRTAFTKEKSFTCLGAAAINLNDYNQDGLFDIVTLASGQGWQMAEIFINRTASQGRFAFTAPELIPVEGNQLLALDLDNNGYDDFITCGASVNGIYSKINTPAANADAFNSLNIYCGEDGFTWMDWSMQQEIQEGSFVIEKSFNGINFFEAGTTTANNRSEGTNEYTFSEDVITNEIAAYRVRFDAKGVKTYSPVVLLNPCDNVVTNFVCVFPNPVDKVMNFQFSIKAEMEIHFEIMDANQQTKLEKSEQVTPGTRTYSLNIEQLEKGSYLLAVRFGNLAPEVCRFEKL